MTPDHHEEMERDYSEQMHRAHDPHYIKTGDIIKPRDDDAPPDPVPSLCALCRRPMRDSTRSCCTTCVPDDEPHGPLGLGEPEEPCVPNGEGLCMTHSTCDCVRHALEEAQGKAKYALTWSKHHNDVLDGIEAQIEGLLAKVRRYRR